jgi:hypothetical protein
VRQIILHNGNIVGVRAGLGGVPGRQSRATDFLVKIKPSPPDAVFDCRLLQVRDRRHQHLTRHPDLPRFGGVQETSRAGLGRQNDMRNSVAERVEGGGGRRVRRDRRRAQLVRNATAKTLIKV